MKRYLLRESAVAGLAILVPIGWLLSSPCRQRLSSSQQSGPETGSGSASALHPSPGHPKLEFSGSERSRILATGHER